MATKVEISLTAGGEENFHFWLQGGWFCSKFDIVIPQTPLNGGMVVGYSQGKSTMVTLGKCGGLERTEIKAKKVKKKLIVYQF